MSQTLLWVTDPWNTLTHSQDTTLRLLEEASNLGIPSYWSGSDILFNPLRPSRFNVVSAADLRDPASMKVIEIEPSKIHQLHYRVDPPVDFNYLSLLEKIAQCVGDENRIFSPPSILRAQSEKVPPQALSHLAPLHGVVQDAPSLRAAFELFQIVPHHVGGCHAAAGAVDAQHDRHHARVGRYGVELLAKQRDGVFAQRAQPRHVVVQQQSVDVDDRHARALAIVVVRR